MVYIMQQPAEGDAEKKHCKGIDRTGNLCYNNRAWIKGNTTWGVCLSMLFLINDINREGRFVDMKINGTEIHPAQGLSLGEILREQGYELTKIAVERNGEIVPKAKLLETAAAENDVIEVVRFVGGG